MPAQRSGLGFTNSKLKTKNLSFSSHSLLNRLKKTKQQDEDMRGFRNSKDKKLIQLKQDRMKIGLAKTKKLILDTI
jgi:hypothetical protein